MSDTEVIRSSETNGKADASLIIGIISILLIIMPIVAVILGIIGLIFGILGFKEIKWLNQKGKKSAISGLICSSLGILLPIILAIIGFLSYMNVNSTVF